MTAHGFFVWDLMKKYPDTLRGEQCTSVDAAADDPARAEEIGDLLFAAVNWARHLGIDPEAALRNANAKFEARFRAMEGHAGDGFAGLSLEEKEALWERVKRG